MELTGYGFRTFRVPRGAGEVEEIDLVERPVQARGEFSVVEIERFGIVEGSGSQKADHDASDVRTTAQKESPSMTKRSEQ